MKTIAITIDDETFERLERLGAREGQKGKNRSRLIREAVKDYIMRLDQEAEAVREAAIVRRHRVRLAHQAAAAVKTQAIP